MGTNRLEAFSDGVIAVIITIMVLELKVPRDTTLTSLRSLAPQFLAYLLSFLVVAIMWVNHHHLLHSARRADARLLWSNNNLLFWMSLVPFVTAYMGNNYRDPRAVGLYGVVLVLCASALCCLRSAIVPSPRQRGDGRATIAACSARTCFRCCSMRLRFRWRLSISASRSSFLLSSRSRIFCRSENWRRS